MSGQPIVSYKFEKESVVVRDTFPTALLTIEVSSKRKVNVQYTVHKDGTSSFTTHEINWFLMWGIQGKQALIKQVVTQGRLAHPAHSVFEILKAHYDARKRKQDFKE